MGSGPSEETIRIQTQGEIEEEAKRYAKEADERWSECAQAPGEICNIGFRIVNARKFMLNPIAEEAMRRLTRLGYKCKKIGPVAFSSVNSIGFGLAVNIEKRKEEDVKQPKSETEQIQDLIEREHKESSESQEKPVERVIDRLRSRYNEAVVAEEKAARAREEGLRGTAQYNFEQIVLAAKEAADDRRSYIEFNFSLVTKREDFSKIRDYLLKILEDENFSVPKIHELLENSPRKGEFSQKIEISGWAPRLPTTL